MEIFIPGRLCLFGEHSDWAAQYRKVNSNINPGYGIVAGIDRGIFARVRSSAYLQFKTTDRAPVLELAMDRALLWDLAQSNSFYSYVAGVAHEALKRYQVGGIAIDNYKMTLPLKKGLSSSAAICVLVARAFNQLYDLGLTIEEEMDLAYWGERATESQCGRLDQACAYGRKPVLLIFDGDRVTTQPLDLGEDLHLIIVDLGGTKDTKTILADLNRCYPVANDAISVGVQNYLGKINTEIVLEAKSALIKGDAAKIGSLMVKAQTLFDRLVAPACPNQLIAPRLHRVLNHPPLQKFIYGGKGVGSQGDGTVQLIAKNRDRQLQGIATIKRDFPEMECYELNLSKTGGS